MKAKILSSISKGEYPLHLKSIQKKEKPTYFVKVKKSDKYNTSFPNDLFSIICTDKEIYIMNIDYLNFLLENEIIFEIQKTELLFFPAFNTNFETPYDILSIVLEIDSDLTDFQSNWQVQNLTILINKKVHEIKDLIVNILKKVEVESINLVFTDNLFFDKNYIFLPGHQDFYLP